MLTLLARLGLRGGEVAERAALTPAEYSSPLARRVYDLRHACVSTWLNAGVPPAQVAEWADTASTSRCCSPVLSSAAPWWCGEAVA